MRNTIKKMTVAINWLTIISLICSTTPTWAAQVNPPINNLVLKPSSKPAIVYLDPVYNADYAKAITATLPRAAGNQVKPAATAPAASPIIAVRPGNYEQAPAITPTPGEISPGNTLDVRPGSRPRGLPPNPSLLPVTLRSGIGGWEGFYPDIDPVILSALPISATHRRILMLDLFDSGDLLTWAYRALLAGVNQNLPGALNWQNIAVQLNLMAHAKISAFKLLDDLYNYEGKDPKTGNKIRLRFVPKIKHSSSLPPGEYYRYGWGENQTYPVIVISDVLYYNMYNPAQKFRNADYCHFVESIIINHSYLYSALAFGYLRDQLAAKDNAEISSLLMQQYYNNASGHELYFKAPYQDIRELFFWLPLKQTLPLLATPPFGKYSNWGFDWFLDYAYLDLQKNPLGSPFKDCDPSLAAPNSRRAQIETSYSKTNDRDQDDWLRIFCYNALGHSMKMMTTSNAYTRLLYPPLFPLPDNKAKTTGGAGISGYAQGAQSQGQQQQIQPETALKSADLEALAAVVAVGCLVKIAIGSALVFLFDGTMIGGGAAGVEKAAEVATVAATGGTVGAAGTAVGATITPIGAAALGKVAASTVGTVAAAYGPDVAKAAVFLLISLSQLGNERQAEAEEMALTRQPPANPGAFTMTVESYRFPGIGVGDMAMDMQGQGKRWVPPMGLQWRYSYLQECAPEYQFNYSGPATSLDQLEMERMLAIPDNVLRTMEAKYLEGAPYMGMTKPFQQSQMIAIYAFQKSLLDYADELKQGTIKVAWLNILHNFEGWEVPTSGFFWGPTRAIYLNREMQSLITNVWDKVKDEPLPERWPNSPYSPGVQGYFAPGLACYYEYVRMRIRENNPALSPELEDIKATCYTLLALCCTSDDQLGFEVGTIENGVPKPIPNSWRPFEFGNMMAARVAFQTLFFNNTGTDPEDSARWVVAACRLAEGLTVTGSQKDAQAYSDDQLLKLLSSAY